MHVSLLWLAIQVKAFVELVATLLSASISNPSSQDAASPPGLAGEMLRVMKEAGVLKGLTNALKLVDNNHPQVMHCDKHCIYIVICSRNDSLRSQCKKVGQQLLASGA